MNPTQPEIRNSDAPSVQVKHCAAIRTILVPISGSETDRVVLNVAWTIAQSLTAHLEILHLRLKLEEAATWSQEVKHFAGSTMLDALDNLARDQDNLSTSAAVYVKQFCREHGVAFNIPPSAAAPVSADCVEEAGSPTETLLLHARNSDLTVVGRSQHDDCLPTNWAQDVLMNSGHPLLLLPKSLLHPLLDTVVVGWKESAASARAIAAALPFLQVARRVVVLNIAEGDSPGLKALEGVGRHLAWHGISAEVRHLGEGIASAEKLLPEAVGQMAAGLLVIGGFSHSRLHETVFGGVTRSLLDKAEFPLFITH